MNKEHLTSAEYNNFIEFFNCVTAKYGDKPAIFYKEDGKYHSVTGDDLRKLVFYASEILHSAGLKKNDCAAIISETRYEWVVADFACISLGIVSVPIYTNMTESQIKYILEHSECKACFVSTKFLAEKIYSIKENLPELQKIISFNSLNGNYPETDFRKMLDKVNSESKLKPNDKVINKYFQQKSAELNPDDLLTIIYTSGTTGIPKGVCLSHKNVLTNIRQCKSVFKLGENDRFLSFLPLAHSYERTCGYYFPLEITARIYYTQSIETLQTQLLETKPTVITTVPNLFKRIQTRILNSIEIQPWYRKMIVKTALKIGMHFRNNKKNILWRIADKLVFKTIRERTGGKIRFFISGGSALNKETAYFFESIGFTILQGYGMTEASPVISVNPPGKNKIGTVGKALYGIEVKTGDDGEILVKGENLMKGYFKNEKDTSETIVDGWLHTGDIGVIDDEGYITVTDRKKTLIKTQSGKYISLTHIEDVVSGSEFIQQVFVYSDDDRHYVTALIVPDYEKLDAKWKIQTENNKTVEDSEELIKFFEKEINRLQIHLSKYERIRKFALLKNQFTIENGEMTPTLKMKRKVIEEKYKTIIDTLYH